MKHSYSYTIVIVLLLVLGLSLAHAQAPSFEEGECPFLVIAPEVEGETIVCGRLTVPENRTSDTGRVLSLQVAIVKSTAETPAEPVVYLEGGPGGAAVVGVPGLWTRSRLRHRGDIIVFDQRGAGYSTPSLDCWELVDPDSDNPVGECRTLLVAQGIDLNAFNSRENAADVADLLQALGIEQASLYGVSYGTRLALTVMRDHPRGIRSVILDGVYPPHVQGLEEQASYGNRAFEVLFNDCQADVACNAAYPDLRQTFYEMVDELNYDPMLDDEGTEITGDDVVNEIFQQLYSTDAIPYLPLLILAAAFADIDTYLDVLEAISEAGALLTAVDEDSVEYHEALTMRFMRLFDLDDFDDLGEYLDELDDDEYDYWFAVATGEINDDSDGMFKSIECQEEVSFNSLHRVFALVESLPEQVANALLSGVEDQFADCLVWNVRRADPIENEPVVSNIPTLLLSGNYDPVTPPEWGDEAAQHLGTSYHFVFPNMGHGTVDVLTCPTSIALAFLHNPVQAPDASCIAQLRPPVFYLP